MATIDTLVQDIYDLFDKPDGHEVAPENVLLFAAEVAYCMQEALAQANDKKGALRASSIGKPCDRQLWYEVNSEDGEEIPSNVKLKFLYGHLIEAMLLFLAREAGHTVEDTQQEYKIDGIKGHIDAKIDGVMVDVKSAASRSFEKFKDGTLPFSDPFGYIDQLSFYKQADGTERAGFLAMDKQHGHLTFFEPTEFNDVRPRIAHLKQVVEEPDAPERCFAAVPDGKSGNMKLPMQCSYCNHKHTCWSDANNGRGIRTFLYSGSPRFLVNVVREPNVKEVV